MSCSSRSIAAPGRCTPRSRRSCAPPCVPGGWPPASGCRPAARSPTSSASRAGWSSRPTASWLPRAIWRSGRARRRGWQRRPSPWPAGSTRQAEPAPRYDLRPGHARPGAVPARGLGSGPAPGAARGARTPTSATRTRPATRGCASRSPPTSAASAACRRRRSGSSCAAASPRRSRSSAACCARAARAGSASRTRATTRRARLIAAMRASSRCRSRSTSAASSRPRSPPRPPTRCSSRPPTSSRPASCSSRRGGRRCAAWARGAGAVVIEDDYDAEYRYDRHPVGALQGLAPEHVVHVHSVSKTLAPGLRLGWAALPARLGPAVAEEKRLSDLGAPVLEQLTLAAFLERGELDRHLRRTRPVYRRRRDALLAALAGLEVEGVAAGLHVLARLPAGRVGGRRRGGGRRARRRRRRRSARTSAAAPRAAGAAARLHAARRAGARTRRSPPARRPRLTGRGLRQSGSTRPACGRPATTKGALMESAARVLVVANKTAATPALLDAVRERAAKGAVRVHAAGSEHDARAPQGGRPRGPVARRGGGDDRACAPAARGRRGRSRAMP